MTREIDFITCPDLDSLCPPVGLGCEKIMGLTVHFKLAASKGCNEEQAKKFVEAMRRVALRFYIEGLVDNVLAITADAKTLRRFANEWLILPVPGQKNTSTGVEVSPTQGFIFCVAVGKDCEPLWLGLCRYPPKVLQGGRELPTRLGNKWRLSGFSKTQYASLHGWEYFQRCHCVVIEILFALRSLELRVRITDEGDYWPRRSLTALRRNVQQIINNNQHQCLDIDTVLRRHAHRSRMMLPAKQAGCNGIVIIGFRRVRQHHMNMMVRVLTVYMCMRKRYHALQECEQHQQQQTDHAVQFHTANCNLTDCFILIRWLI